MSASTGAIQRRASHGSIFRSVALTAAALLTLISIAWGAMTLTAAKPVVGRVPAPIILDKGSRSELSAPATAPLSIPRFRDGGDGLGLDRGGRGEVVTHGRGKSPS